MAIKPAGFAPFISSTLFGPFKTTKVGIAETENLCATSGTASTSTLRN